MSLIRRDVIKSAQRVLLAALMVVGLAILSLTARAVWTWERSARPVPTPSPLPGGSSPPAAATAALGVTVPPQETPAPDSSQPEPTVAHPNRIGIVAGHWQSDSGAVCDDGLEEVQINLDIAQRVVAMLSQAGYETEILAEFSPELNGYQAAALVSIHTDSCNIPEASGFKAARVSASVVPDIEDRLVACLIEEYHASTGLQFHSNSITFDMTEYHAFYEIAPETPAAIIEIGFMAADRQLLTRRQDRVAQGIATGIKCFMAARN
jgi:N-acetylmuramoyl-L-alanine amidase